MSDDRQPPRMFGWVLPSVATVVGATVLASVVAYFAFDRATANLVAIVGAVLVTIVAVKHDRARR